MWGKFFRRFELHDTRIERLETPDGDFLNVHHLDAPPGSPILVLLHGLEGSVRSHYIQGLLREARRRSWRAAALVFRSCGGEPNRLQRSYHSGDTGDLDYLLSRLHAQFPSAPFLLAGVSLGGNVLLKYLGEQGSAISSRVKGAAAISVPYDLSRSSRFIDQGFSRVYQWNFLRSLRAKAMAKVEQFPGIPVATGLSTARTIFDFDDCFTAPVHGFADAEDYYTKSSSLGWLETISIKTLLLSAVDDPFLPPQVLDDVRLKALDNPNLEAEFTPHGGHVGFVGGRNPLSPDYYLERRVTEFLAGQLTNGA